MAENSYFFTAVSGSPAYSASDFVTWLYNTMGRPDGVIRGLDNALAVTVDGAGNAVVNTGCATKTGHGYTNTSSLTKALTLPSPGYKQYTTLVVRVDSTPSPNTMHVVTLAGTAVLIANTATPASITAGTDVYLADVLTSNTAGTYSYTVTDQRVYAPIPAGNTNWAAALKTDIGANWPSALAEALSQSHVPSSSAALAIQSSWNTALTTALGTNWPTFLAYNPSNVWRGEKVLLTSGSGNWTVPDGVRKIRVTCVGGGGGGGAGSDGGSVPGIGGGGGGGTNISAVIGDVISVTPGTLLAYSVGSGGSGGSGSGANGSSGTSSTFSGATTGVGGGGGNGGDPVTACGVGGTGSSNGAGAAGGGGHAGKSAGGIGGQGGGAGGQGGLSNAAGSSGNYGGGGGGGGGSGGGTGKAGGTGGSGIIIIEY